MPSKLSDRTDAQREADARYRESRKAFLKEEQWLIREIARTRRAIERCNATVGRDELAVELMPPGNDRDLVRSIIVWNTNELANLRRKLPEEEAQLAALRANRPARPPVEPSMASSAIRVRRYRERHREELARKAREARERKRFRERLARAIALGQVDPFG